MFINPFHIKISKYKLAVFLKHVLCTLVIKVRSRQIYYQLLFLVLFQFYMLFIFIFFLFVLSEGNTDPLINVSRNARIILLKCVFIVILLFCFSMCKTAHISDHHQSHHSYFRTLLHLDPVFSFIA